MQHDSLLEGIDIYGWGKDRENMVLASLVAHLNTLVQGDKGMGKTLIGLRLAEAMDVAAKAKGFDGFQSTKVDGHSANEEDLVGYPMPPDDEEMKEARKSDDPIYMETVLSPNTIANSEFIVLDEATRIQHHMQNRYLGMMEEGIVDGRELSIQHLFGAANPISYAGTEEMDEALADRWEFIIPAPSYEEMPRESRINILKTRAEETHDNDPDPEAAIRIWEFVEEAREAFASAVKNDLDRVCQYVDNVVCLINRGIKGKTTADDPDLDVSDSGLTDPHTHTSPIGARRATILVNNIFALFAVSSARGEDSDISSCGEIALHNSLVHTLHGDDPIPDEMLKVAHETHKGLLQSKEERVLSMIESEDEVVERVAMAFRLRARTEDTTRYVEEAYQHFTDAEEDDMRHAFSYALYNRLQESEDDLHNFVDQRVMGDIASDVQDVLDAAEAFSIEEDSVHPEMSGVEHFENLVKEFSKRGQTPEGRAAIALATYSYSTEDSEKRTNPLNTSSAESEKHKSVISSLKPAQDNIDYMVDTLGDLSRHQHALSH